MRFLTPLTAVHGFTLLDKMSRAQTIKAQLVGLQCRELVLVGHCLEPWTSIEGMLGSIADNAIDEWLSCAGEGSNGLGGFLGRTHIIPGFPAGL